MRAIADPARLDRRFFALADVQRRGMLDRLCRGPASVSELAEPLGIALPSAVTEKQDPTMTAWADPQAKRSWATGASPLSGL